MIILDVRLWGGGGGLGLGLGLGLGGVLVSRLSDRVLQAWDGVSRKNRFKTQINCNAENN